MTKKIGEYTMYHTYQYAAYFRALSYSCGILLTTLFRLVI